MIKTLSVNSGRNVYPEKKSDSQINMRGGFFSKFTENRLEINICK